MNIRQYRAAGWAAILSGIVAIIGLVSLVLFFWLEADSGQEHLWGPVSDICPIVQMVLLLVVARAVYRMQRPGAPGFSLTATVIGMAGMLGVVLLQLLLVIRVIRFEQEVGLVVFATGIVGVWLILVNYSGRRQGGLPSRLAWLGMAVGVAFVLEPVMLAAVGGGADWRAFMSNYLLLVGSAVIFLVSYVGFPIWAMWLGRTFLTTKATEGVQQQGGLIPDRDAG